jgi:hypothetical protein
MSCFDDVLESRPFDEFAELAFGVVSCPIKPIQETHAEETDGRQPTGGLAKVRDVKFAPGTQNVPYQPQDLSLLVVT